MCLQENLQQSRIQYKLYKYKCDRGVVMGGGDFDIDRRERKHTSRHPVGRATPLGKEGRTERRQKESRRASKDQYSHPLNHVIGARNRSNNVSITTSAWSARLHRLCFSSNNTTVLLPIEPAR